MVRKSYCDIDEVFNDIKAASSNRTACSIMILIANEVDAMASSRMLKQYLRMENLAYVSRPVNNIEQIQAIIATSLTSDIKSVILINCGAINNIPKLFQLEHGGDYRVFILDNHRPLHLANIYSHHSVVVFDDVEDVDNDDTLDLPSDGSVLSDEDIPLDELEEEDDREDADSYRDEEDFVEDDRDEDQEAEAEFDENGDENEASEAEEAEDDEAESQGHDEEEGEDIGNEENENGEEEEGVEINEDILLGEEDSKEGEGEDDGEEDTIIDDPVDIEDSPTKKRVFSVLSEEKKDADGDEGDTGAATEEDDHTEIVDDDPIAAVALDLDDEDEEGDMKVVGKRRKVLEDKYDSAKQRYKRLKKYYTDNAYYTHPTAIMMLSLFGRYGSLIPLDITWQSILGLTDHYLRQTITEMKYIELCDFLSAELSDHMLSATERNQYTAVTNTARGGEDGGNGNNPIETTIQGSEAGNVKETLEYRFFLYRHWALFDAMYHSSYMAAKMSVWQSQGRKKLQELLATIGLPLQHSQQIYTFIPDNLRSHFRRQITNETSMRDYNLVNPGVMYRSFHRYNNFKNPVIASDVVLSSTALLELCYNTPMQLIEGTTTATPVGTGRIGVANITPAEGNADTPSTAGQSAADYEANLNAARLNAFNNAFDCLSLKNSDIMKKGVEIAIELQRQLVRKAAVLLESDDLIVRLGRLYYCYIHSTKESAASRGPVAANGNSNTIEFDEPFARPQVLMRLGQYIMDVKRNLTVRQGGWTGSSLLPLILLSQKKETYMIVGISPLSSLAVANDTNDSSDRIQNRLKILTNFRYFYKQAAKKAHAKIFYSSFDPNIVEVHRDDVSEFLGELNYLMKREDDFKAQV